MPRDPAAKYDNNGHYYSNNQNSAPYPQSQGAPGYMDPQQIVPVIQDPVSKKKHVCPTCDRTFTTSGHLARHARVHTGEKNHQCPFPNCKTRCSRQDNLQQHYRIHLSPGSRRRSTAASRTAMIRSYSGDQPASVKRGSHTTLTAQLPPINYPSPPPPPPSPPIDPPALEQAYSHMPPGPDSPPPLVQANLPTPYADSGSSRSPSPPEYIPAPVQATNDYIPVSNYPLGIAHTAQYGDGAPTYQDQSQNALYAFENGSSQSQPAAAVDNVVVHSNSVQEQTFAYSNSFGDHHSSTQHISSSPVEHVQHIDNAHSSSNSPVSSRHSISHISNPQAYSHHAHSYPPASVPPSPASARSASSHASLASGPHTPAYTYQDEVEEPTRYHTAEASFEPISDASCISAGYYDSHHGELVTTTYASQLTTDPHATSYSNRYHSSPPILASSVQERLGHGELQHAHAHSHSSPSTCMTISAASAQSPLSPYLHHPRPLSGSQQQQHYQLPHLSLHPVEWGKSHAALPAIHN